VSDNRHAVYVYQDSDRTVNVLSKIRARTPEWTLTITLGTHFRRSRHAWAIGCEPQRAADQDRAAPAAPRTPSLPSRPSPPSGDPWCSPSRSPVLVPWLSRVERDPRRHRLASPRHRRAMARRGGVFPVRPAGSPPSWSAPPVPALPCGLDASPWSSPAFSSYVRSLPSSRSNAMASESRSSGLVPLWMLCPHQSSEGPLSFRACSPRTCGPGGRWSGAGWSISSGPCPG